HEILLDPTVIFDWASVDEAIDYEFQISRDWTFATVLHTTTTTIPTYTYMVSCGQGYYWRVRANLVSGQTDWSEDGSFSCSFYGPPTLLSPAEGISQTDSTMTFTWEAVPGAEKYYIQIALFPDGNSTFYSNTAFTNSYTEYFIQPNIYYWRVVAQGPNIPNQWNGGVFSEFRQFVVAQATIYSAYELDFYHAFQNYADENMAVIVVDITPEGVWMTVQFSDNAIAIFLLELNLGNRFIYFEFKNLAWVQGGTPEQISLIYEQIPTMFLEVLLDVLPNDYLWIDNLELSHYDMYVEFAFMPQR
ncbi:MAG: hypothetical protein KJ043_12440, partial [Anaerolineae bacterium]|nr:hypothetical protein [Anaerolineae bacterium]